MTQFTLETTACPKCTARAPRGMRFCASCGADLVSGELARTPALDDEPRPPNGRPLQIALGLAALALLLAGFAVLDRPESVADATASLRGEVAELENRVADLETAGEQLAARVDSAEDTASRSQSGSVAGLAQKTLRSVFTITTRKALGAGFVAWTEGGATFVVTANHVVADSPSRFVTIERRNGSWSGEIVRTDPRNDLAVIRVNGRIKGAEPLWQKPSDGGTPSPARS